MSHVISEECALYSSARACRFGVRVVAAWSSSIAATGCTCAVAATSWPTRAKARMPLTAPSAAPARSGSGSVVTPTGGRRYRRSPRACGRGLMSACGAATLRCCAMEVQGNRDAQYEACQLEFGRAVTLRQWDREPHLPSCCKYCSNPLRIAMYCKTKYNFSSVV
jgi:hypothetical protein